MADNTTLGASFSIDISDLKAGLRQASRLIKESNSEFKAATAGLDDYTKSQTGLEAKLKNLNSVYKVQKEVLKAYEKQYEEAGYAIDDMSAAAVELRTKINNQKAAVEKTRSEIDKYETALEDLKEATDETQTASQRLRSEISRQEKEIADLQEAYTDVVLEQGKSSDEAKELQSKIKNLNSELKKNKSSLKDASAETEDFEEAENDAKDSTSKFDIAVGNLAANLVSNFVSAIGSAVSRLANLSEETREYREDIGKLKTAFESAGKTTEEATAAYKDLYSVLGEEDRSVEAVNHLAKLVDTEEELALWTGTILPGVWGTFGDSLPIEGLTEAANETAKVGKLTGVLADALNWAGVNEDEFQESLDKCTTEQERQRLITKTLNGLYSKSAAIYKENNKSVIASRKATSEYTDVLADMGEEMEPVNTAVTELKTELIKGLSPSIKKTAIPAVKDLLKEFQKRDTIEKFSKSVENISEKVFPVAGKAVVFLAENLDKLVGITFTAITVYKTFQAAMAVSTAISAAQAAVAGLSAATGIATTVQVGFNAAMAANPIGAVATAAALLTTGIIALVASEKDATSSTDLLTESQREAVTAAQEAAEAYRENKAAADQMAAGELANIEHTQKLWQELQTLADENGKVKEGYEGRAQFILGQLNEALGTEYEMNGNIIQSYQDIKQSIEDVILSKKAQILLEAHEDSYREAIEKVSEAERARATLAQELAAQQAIYDEAYKKAQDARTALDEKVANAKTEADYRKLASEAQWVQNLETQAVKEKEILDQKGQEYNNSEASLYTYYQDISDYEKASTLVLEGETEKAVGYLNNLGSGFKTAAGTAELSAKEQKKVLEQQVIDTEVNARLMRSAYENGVKGVTEDMVKTAEEQAEQAKEEFLNIGGEITKGIGEGAEAEKWTLTGAMTRLINSAVSAAKKAAGIESPAREFKKPVGGMIGLGVAAGIDDSTRDVLKSVKKQVKSIENAYDVSGLSGELSASISKKGKTGSGTAESSASGGVVVYQTNNYSQAHSRYELYKSKQQTAAAVRLAIGTV